MQINVYFIVAEALFYVFHLSVLILLIVKHKSAFNGPYYNIFRVVMVTDLLNYFYMCGYQYISTIPQLIPFYKSNLIFAPINQIFFCYIIIIIFFGHFLMNFNRFTILWFPIFYQKLWSRQRYIPLLLLIPITNTCWRIHEPVHYVYISENTARFIYLDANFSAINFMVSFIIYLSMTFLGAILNGLSLFKLCINKSSTINVNEKRLLFVSLITFFAQIFRTLYPIQQFLWPNNDELSEIFLQMLPFSTDIFALSGSISLLILSKSVRKEYFSFYFWKFKHFEHSSGIQSLAHTAAPKSTNRISTV